MADSTIGKAFVQIVPSADGITEKMNAVLGAPSREAGAKAGTEMSGSMGAMLGSGLLSAVSGIASKIAGAMKTAIAEVSSFVADSVSVGMDFDSQMSQIAATMGITTEAIKNNEEILDAYGKTTGQKAGDTFDMLRDKAKEMGAATNFSASQAAEGLNILAMSGYDAENSISMIEDVLHLAAAGGMDMATSAKDISGAMKGFNDAAKDSAYYADLMAKGATLANTNVTQLGEALSGAAAQGAAYKQDAEDMTVALLRLAEQGETGSNAATMLGAAMKNLYTPTNEAAIAMNELGVSAYDQEGNFKDINTVVNELNKSLGEYSDEQQAAYINTIFGIQGQEAYNKMVVTSIDKQEEWAAALANASGEAAKQYTTMTDNLAGDIDIWNSALEGFKIEIADQVMPTVREFVQFGSEGLSRLTAAFKEGGIEGMVKEFSKLLEELTAKVVDILPQVTDVFVSLFVALAGNLADILPTFVGAIKSAVPEIISTLFSIGATLTYCIPDVIDMIAAVISEALKMIPGYLPDIAEMIKNIIPDLINDITEMLPLVLDTIISIIDTLAALIPDLIPPIFEAIVNAIPMLAQTIADNLPVVIETLTDLVNTVAELIPGILPVLLPALTQASVALIQGLAAAMAEMPTFASAVLDCIMAVVDTLLDNIEPILDCVGTIIEACGKAMLDNFPELAEAAGKFFVKLIDVIVDWYPKMFDAAERIWSKIIDGVKAAARGIGDAVYEWGDSVIEAADEIAEAIIDFFGGPDGPLGKIIEIGGNLVEGLLEGMKKKLNKLKENLSDFGESIAETLCDFFDIHSPSKLMENLIGKNLALGIDVGFTSNMDKVTKDMGRSVRGVIDELAGYEMNANAVQRTDLTQIVSSTADTGTADVSPSGTPVTIQIVTPDRRVLAEWLVPDMNDIMGGVIELQTRGIAT